ncbi:MAG: tetratricopeptide repeat protein [Myxococcota bacterium]
MRWIAWSVDVQARAIEIRSEVREDGFKRRLGFYLYCAVLTVVFSLGACAHISREEQDRSRREFELAATLHAEGNNQAIVVERLRGALELDPENAEAHLLLGYIHMERSDWETAVKLLKRGLRFLIARQEGDSLVAEAKNVLGAALVHAGRSDEAIPILRQSATDLLNTAPQHAWGNLGMAYIEQQSWDRALEALEAAVEVQPRFCRGYFLMGQVHFARVDLEPAEEVLTQAVEADDRCTGYQDAYKLRGEVRARLGSRTEAIGDFERCVEINADSEAGRACRRLLEGAL